MLARVCRTVLQNQADTTTLYIRVVHTLGLAEFHLEPMQSMVYDAKRCSSGSMKSHRLSIVRYQLLNLNYLTKVCVFVWGSTVQQMIEKFTKINGSKLLYRPRHVAYLF